MGYTVKEVAVDAILGIRSAELREGMDLEDCRFEGDTDADTVHLALFHEDVIVGCLSVLKSSNEDFDAPGQHQYRGMAVSKAYQGNSIGNLLLKKADEIVRSRGSRFIWLNARVIALNFYGRNGYTIQGKGFDIPGVGGHYLMYKEL